jgi:hypothetical protein
MERVLTLFREVPQGVEDGVTKQKSDWGRPSAPRSTFLYRVAGIVTDPAGAVPEMRR